MTRFKVAVGLCAMLFGPLAILDTAAAAPCRDSKGKFVTCPPVAAKKAPCRDGKGKFVACPATMAPKQG